MAKNNSTYNIRSVQDYLNWKFAEVLSNDKGAQYQLKMVKFRGRSRMKKYIKCKPIN